MFRKGLAKVALRDNTKEIGYLERIQKPLKAALSISTPINKVNVFHNLTLIYRHLWTMKKKNTINIQKF